MEKASLRSRQETNSFQLSTTLSLSLSLSPCHSSGFESRVKLDNSESKFCQKITFTGKEFESELNCAQDNQHKCNYEYNLSRSVFNTHSELIFPACHPLFCLSLTDLFVKLNQGINSKNRFDCSGISSLRHIARFAPMFNLSWNFQVGKGIESKINQLGQKFTKEKKQNFLSILLFSLNQTRAKNYHLYREGLERIKRKSRLERICKSKDETD